MAGLFAALFVIGMQDPLLPANYVHYLLSAESDTMIVALVLAAIDCHLNGRHRWAFWIWWLGSLGRPEVWPFWLLAGLWLWRTEPTYRRWLVFSVLFLLFLWFGIPGLTSKSVFTAANIAQNSARECHGNKVVCTIKRYQEMHATAVWILAALSVVWPIWRRNWAILVLAAGALAWLIIEVALAVKGFPAVPRYMFESGAVVAILAGIFIGRLDPGAAGAPGRARWAARAARGVSPRRSPPARAGGPRGSSSSSSPGRCSAPPTTSSGSSARPPAAARPTVLIGRMSGVDHAASAPRASWPAVSPTSRSSTRASLPGTRT